MKNSPLPYEGEKRYRGADSNGSTDDTVSSLYSKHPFYLSHLVNLRKVFSKGTIPTYKVTEYKLPLNKLTDRDMLKACLFVSISESNPKLFDIGSVVGNAVAAAWVQYGQFNHFMITAMYIVFLVITTLSNYYFHDWVLTDGGLNVLSWVLIAIIFLLTVIFMFLESHEFTQRLDDTTDQMSNREWVAYVAVCFIQYSFDGMNVLDWTAYILVFAGCVLRVKNQSETNDSASIMAIGTMLLWLKMTHFLRPFELTGPLVRMIFVILFKIKELLLILFIVIVSYAQALYLLSYEAENLEFSNRLAGLMQSFLWMMGQSKLSQLQYTSNPVLAQFLLVVYILISTILILNLLIALMNSAYTEIASNAVPEWNRERAIIITQQFYFYKPTIMKVQYFLVRANDVTKQTEARKVHLVELIKATEERIVNALEAKMQESEERIQAKEAKMKATEKRIVKLLRRR